MAADEQTNTKAKLKPIAIRSKRIVNEISNVVTSTINGVSNENVYWSNEEKERCKDRFNQVNVFSILIFSVKKSLVIESRCTEDLNNCGC